MTTDDPRDRALERLLGRRPETSASAECLDAETIAAWADGGLDGPVLARAEAHMSTCGRCQTVMATLVQMPAAEAPAIESTGRQSRPWWHIDLRWLMPLAGAATAVLVWMAVPQRTPEPPVSEEAKAESSIAARDQTRPAAEPESPSAPVTAPAVAAPAATAADKLAVPSRDLAARQEAEGRLARREPTSPALAKDPAVGRERPAETADRQAKAEAPAAPLAESVTLAPSPSANAAATAEKQNAPAAQAAAGFSAEADAARGRVGAASPALSIVSRDPAVRWRARGDRMVERSVDGGATWTPADTGTAAALLGGASPSASVCWLVGRGGVVLLTTNARTWQRLPSPVAEDLVFVEATDDRRATVRTAAGVSYQTADGGATWTRL